MKEKAIRIAGVVPESIVDGPGMRYVIFTQGCPHKCKGCHNPDTHDFDKGTDVLPSKLLKNILDNPIIAGVTFSGGEPFAQADRLTPLAEELKSNKKNLMVYTGYTFEELLKNGTDDMLSLLWLTDILVDGRFEEDKKSLELRFRGSSNQRIIDVPKSLKKMKPVWVDWYQVM